MRVLQEEFSSHTVLSISHRLGTLLYCDNIVVLEFGEIVESGSPDALLKKDRGFFKNLRDQQLGNAA